MIPVDEAPADAAHLDIVLARRVQWQGVLERGGVVNHLDARRAPQDLPGLIRVHGELRLDDDRFGVRPKRRHANGGARDLDVLGEAKDLSDLPRDLHLLLRVAVGLKGVDLGDDVERQLVSKGLRRGHLTLLDPSGEAILELRHALGSGAARRLVRGHQDALQLVLLVQRPQDHGADGRGAVRISDQRRLGVLPTVDLRDDQRHAVIQAPSG
mmetsp:Transcript_21599/g.62099  ORF Transcript_21599/g.62099 Transcript_21599/m.62099 type:complete len:212 (+) Transcript_21599:129-764(+)